MMAIDDGAAARHEVISPSGPLSLKFLLATPMRAIPPSSRWLIVLLGAIAALPPLSIDMGLPALEGTQASLQATAGQASMTLSIFLCGFASGPLVMGPLADRFGRRPVLLAGTSIFAAAGLACAVSPSITMLLASRLVQGVGAGAAATLSMVVVRDLYVGDKARAMISHVSLVTGLAPIVAPMMGATILSFASWRMIYLVLGIAGTALLAAVMFSFAETAPQRQPGSRPPSLHPAQVALSYIEMLRHRVFLGHALINAASFGCMFAYISNSPLIFMHNLGVSKHVYSGLFAFTASMLMLGAIINGRCAKHGIPGPRMLSIGQMAMVLATLALLAVAWTGTHHVLPLVLPIAICFVGLGIVMPTANHAALQPMGHRAGTAGAVLRGAQMAAGAFTSFLVAAFYDGHSAHSVAIVMSATACLAMGLRVALLRPAAS